jgi:hypothetical protein
MAPGPPQGDSPAPHASRGAAESDRPVGRGPGEGSRDCSSVTGSAAPSPRRARTSGFGRGHQRREEAGTRGDSGSPTLFEDQGRVRELVTKAHLPAISAWRLLPESGGLKSYGADIPAMFRRAAVYVDKILRRETRRASRRSAHKVRADHQSQDREGARVDDPAISGGAGRSGDRVARARPTGQASESSTRLR